MNGQNFIAVDLGASNGRVVLGRLLGGRLGLEIVYRFDHAIRFVDGHKRWDWERIRSGVREGLARAAEQVGDEPVASVSCDAWAQDFGLLGANDELIYTPVSYRDARSEKIPEGYFDHISPEQLVARVGVGALSIVALCQLYVMARQRPAVLKQSKTLLHIADLVHHDLCGIAATDWTLATASQLRNLATGQWDRELLDLMGVPHHLLPRLANVPSVLGSIPADRAPHPKLVGVPVVISANHDTAAASVAAWPLDDETVFLSEGTYAMLGCVSDQPIISPQAVRAGCAVVGLAERRWGLFTSLMGLWILQECYRLWNKDGTVVSYAEVSRQAESAAVEGVIALNQPRFRAPSDMRAEVRQACMDAGVRPPQGPAEFARLIFDSMASEHRTSVKFLSGLTGRRFRCVRMVSGGCQNAYFCQRLADALGVPVVAGPAEATALGNVILQAQVMGALASGAETTRVLEASVERIRYAPSRR